MYVYLALYDTELSLSREQFCGMKEKPVDYLPLVLEGEFQVNQRELFPTFRV